MKQEYLNSRSLAAFSCYNYKNLCMLHGQVFIMYTSRTSSLLCCVPNRFTQEQEDMKIKFNIVSNQFKCYKNEICQHLELSKNQSNVIRAMLVFHGNEQDFIHYF